MEQMDFTGFLGNAELKQRLSASFDSGRNSHCYLLCGPAGSGKRTLTRILSAALQCTNSIRPCGVCVGCRKVLTNQHPDVITVDDSEKKQVAVGLIRQLQSDAFVLPNEGRHKIYVIPRAQDMNENAQNALLKLIEEPPSHAVFFLLTDNSEKLLPTVRSRCAELRLEPVPKRETLLWLSEQCPGRTQSELEAAFLRSGGYLGQARNLLEGELLLPQTVRFAECYTASDRFAMTELLCSMEKLPREKLLAVLLHWKQLLADALLVRAGMPGSPQASALGQRRTARALAEASAAIQKAMDACEANIGGGHICGWLLVTLI